MASIRVGSLFGIPIRLGASFLLVVPILAYLIGAEMGPMVEVLNVTFATAIDPDPLTAGITPWVLGLVAALGLFVSVLFHELGHSLVGRYYDHEVEAITLWFLGGLAQFTEMPDSWRQEFAIAVIGPVVSIAIGVACYAAMVLVPPEFSGVVFLFAYLAILNVVLAGFNMLPAFPMDGGRVMRAVLSRNRSRVKATQQAAGVGKLFAVVFAIVGVLAFNLFLLLIAFFVFIAASGEARQAVTEAAFEGLLVRDLMTPATELDTVAPETSLQEVLDRMVHERHTGYPVIDNGDLVGIVTLEDIDGRTDDHNATVREVMSTDLFTVGPDAEARDALRTLQREDVGRILVTDEAGDLVGLISRTDLMTVLEITRTEGAAAETPRATGA